jgi:hypothetical protein
VTKNLRVRATFLLDGFVRGTWEVERKKAAATLVITHVRVAAESCRQGPRQRGRRASTLPRGGRVDVRRPARGLAGSGALGNARQA